MLPILELSTEYTTPSSAPDQVNSSSVSKLLAWDTPRQTKDIRPDELPQIRWSRKQKQSPQEQQMPGEGPGAGTAGKGAGEAVVGEAVWGGPQISFKFSSFKRGHTMGTYHGFSAL